MGMEEALFHTYVSKLLREAGHMTQTAPIYVNCSIQTALFIENDRQVTLSETDCATLSYVSHVSLLTELTWAGTEKVQLYAVTADFPLAHRSQDIVETHRLLQGAWHNRHSIVFFQNADAWAVSFADDAMTQVLSDWFPFADEDSAVSARLSIENISLSDCTAYFQDFQYAMARDYYVHPISRTGARYAWLPRDLLQAKYEEDTDILTEPCVSQDEFRSIVHGNICYYENVYGDDYVEPCYTKIEKGKAERKAKEAERIARAEAEAKKAAVGQLANVLREIIEKTKRLERAEAERIARAEAEAKKAAVGQLANVLREIIEKTKRLERAEAERIAKAEAEARKAAVGQLASVLREIIEKAERLERAEAERIARKEVERKAKAEAERQAEIAAIRQLAVAIRQVQLSKQAKEAERIARAEAERKANEAIARIEQLGKQHDETVSRLQQRCRAEMDLVQVELSAVSARLFQVEQALVRLHILQFKKKKQIKAEQDTLLQKQKKLQLLLVKIQESLQQQLEQEDKAYAQALAMLQQKITHD